MIIILIIIIIIIVRRAQADAALDVPQAHRLLFRHGTLIICHCLASMFLPGRGKHPDVCCVSVPVYTCEHDCEAHGDTQSMPSPRVLRASKPCSRSSTLWEG